MKNFLLLASMYLFVTSCTDSSNKDSMVRWKNEILKTEQDFADLVREEGIRTGFLAYAADSAVLMRNDSLILGREGITAYFNNQSMDDNSISLTWEPDFVDVSASGDLGYTYGHYTFTYIDSSGSKVNHRGVFHTVWKKQSDGSWRFVWD